MHFYKIIELILIVWTIIINFQQGSQIILLKQMWGSSIKVSEQLKKKL